MNRRKFLGALTMAPVAGQEALKQAAAKLSGSSAVAGALNGLAGPVGEPSASSGYRTVHSFAEYLLLRRDHWERRSRQITHIDPDLLAMRLPVATLFRMQRARNFERIRSEEEFNFSNVFSRSGKFEFWE